MMLKERAKTRVFMDLTTVASKEVLLCPTSPRWLAHLVVCDYLKLTVLCL
jgi:hypothetical protein